MFTSIADPTTGIEYQIKCGWDVCDTFKLGDKVPSEICQEYPKQGYLLDDVYDGCAYPNKDVWVIIKDSIVVAIEPMTESGDDYNLLRKKYQIKNYPNNLWEKNAWERKEKLEEECKKEHEEFMMSISHLSPTEQFVKIMVRHIQRMMNYESVGRKAFKIEDLKIENNG